VTDVELRDALVENRCWDVFLKRYRRMLYAVITRVTKEATDDILHNTIVALLTNDYQRLRSWDPRRGMKLSTWISMIAVQAAHDWIRAHRRQSREVYLEEQLWIHPIDKMIREEVWENLGVNDRDRRLISLLRAGYSNPEIARRFRVTPQTIASKKHKLLRSLAH